jgi:hypothetical protein
MGRPKGSTNKPGPVEWPMNLSTEERMELIANYMLDIIEEDQKAGFPLLRKIQAAEKASKQQPLKQEELTLSRNTRKPFYAHSIHYH